MIQQKALKPRKCKHCRDPYTPSKPMQTACSIPCALALAQKAKEKAQAVKAKEERKADRAKLKSMAPLRTFIAEAQTAFNAFVRERDKDLPCISCGDYNPIDFGVGGAWDCGHFLSRGAYPEKRFMEDNAHKQCKSCNAGSAKNPAKAMTVMQAYEANLVARIGQERVDAVKAPMPVKKWTREELAAIRDHYRKALREMKKQE